MRKNKSILKFQDNARVKNDVIIIKELINYNKEISKLFYNSSLNKAKKSFNNYKRQKIKDNKLSF